MLFSCGCLLAVGLRDSEWPQPNALPCLIGRPRGSHSFSPQALGRKPNHSPGGSQTSTVDLLFLQSIWRPIAGILVDMTRHDKKRA